MNFLIFAALAHLARCGVISQEHGIEHHERATSYQNIHIEHFHPVPTYIRKEDSHLLQHPISLGTSSSKVEVHHGGKHDHGYGFANSENNIHGHAFADFDGLLGGHEAAATVNHQVQEQGEYSPYEGHLRQAAALGQYQLESNGQEYANLEGHVQYGNHESR